MGTVEHSRGKSLKMVPRGKGKEKGKEWHLLPEMRQRENL